MIKFILKIYIKRAFKENFTSSCIEMLTLDVVDRVKVALALTADLISDKTLK